jgi:hypothetical protein
MRRTERIYALTGDCSCGGQGVHESPPSRTQGYTPATSSARKLAPACRLRRARNFRISCCILAKKTHPAHPGQSHPPIRRTSGAAPASNMPASPPASPARRCRVNAAIRPGLRPGRQANSPGLPRPFGSPFAVGQRPRPTAPSPSRPWPSRQSSLTLAAPPGPGRADSVAVPGKARQKRERRNGERPRPHGETAKNGEERPGYAGPLANIDRKKKAPAVRRKRPDGIHKKSRDRSKKAKEESEKTRENIQRGDAKNLRGDPATQPQNANGNATT